MTLADTAKKGDLLDVTGRVKTETWTGQDGQQRSQLTITADSWARVGQPQQQASAPAPAPAPAPAAKTQPDWTSSDAMPF